MPPPRTTSTTSAPAAHTPSQALHDKPGRRARFPSTGTPATSTRRERDSGGAACAKHHAQQRHAER